MQENLKQKVIEQQDILAYFGFNSFGELLTMDSSFQQKFGYSNYKEMISENPDLIDKLSMNNLLCLLNSEKDDVKKLVQENIMKRITENGEHLFSGEDIEISAFGVQYTLMSLPYRKDSLDKENMEIIKDKIYEDWQNLKTTDLRSHNIIGKASTITTIDKFLSVYEKGTFSSEKLDLLEKMVEENPQILEKINYRIFEDPIWNMGEKFVMRAAKYPNFSNKLIKLSKNNESLFEKLNIEFQNLEQNSQPFEALKIEDTLLRYATLKCCDLEDVNMEDLINCSIRSKEVLPFSLDYEENYEEKFDKACDERFERSYLDKKEIFLAKYLGMNELDAKKFSDKFLINSEPLNIKDEELKDYMNLVQRVLEMEEEEIIDLYWSMDKKVLPRQKLHYEQQLVDEYTKTYVECLTKTHENLQNKSEYQQIEVNGKMIKQIKLDPNMNFSALFHSTDTGFKGDKELINDSFADSYNQMDPSIHLKASCFVNQDFMGHAPVGKNGVLMAYAEVQKDAINLVGPTDIDSHIRNYDIDAGNAMYMTAENLPYASRKVYNEVPIEKQPPDYIVIYDDFSKQHKANAYKAASEFECDILYIDKRDIVHQQLNALDALMRKFEDTKDLSVMQEMVCKIETNMAGWLLNRDDSEPDDSLTQSINNERFRQVFEHKKQEIYHVIEHYIDENFEREGEMRTIMEIMQKEEEKYNLIDLKAPISKTKIQFDTEGIKAKIQERTSLKEHKTVNDTLNVVDLQEICQESAKIVSLSEVGKMKTQIIQKEENREIS